MPRRLLIIITIILLVLSGIAGCAGGNGGARDEAAGGGARDSSQADPDPGGPADESRDIGAESDPADGTILEDLNGDPIALSDYNGKIVVLNFWASWCPPCRQEMPELDELDQELKESGDAVFISVNLTDGQRETAEKARQYIEENGFGFTVLLDDRGLLAYEYAISSIPQTFILDRNGEIAGSILGSTTRAAILEKVAAVK